MNVPTHISACLLAVSLSASGFAGAATACGAGDIIFEDPLTELDFSWGLSSEDETRSFGPGGLTWTLEPEIPWLTLNHASLYEDVELCVDTGMEYPEEAGAYIGLAFWGVDKQNTYTVDLFPYDGAFSVFRLQNGKVLTPVGWTENAAIKKEPGAVNHLSVMLKGNQAVITINETKILEFKGIPPKDGALAGLDMGTAKDDSGPTKFTFANFQVRELAE